jgi:hypothetical protein
VVTLSDWRLDRLGAAQPGPSTGEMGQRGEESQARKRACPALESLAAFIDGSLNAAQRRKMIGHLGRCPDCYTLFAETLRCLLEG